MLLFLFLLHHVEATEIPKQPVTKHVTECPAVGYFFKREFVEENKVCYLCFCKEDDMAICFPRDNKRCDAESFHFHGIGKREQRLRRSPSLAEIFSRDSARNVFHKQSSQACKPHEGSKSEGCPPADWCTGCTVCDCNSKGQWDCHILSFCPDEEKQAMQKKREAIKNYSKRRKAKNAPRNEQEKVFRSTKQIFTANGKKKSVKSNKVQTKNFQQVSKKNTNLNMKKKLAPQRRSPQIIKKSQNQNRKKDNRYLALSTGKSRQKKMVVSPKKNNSQKARVVKSSLVRNTSKKVQVKRTPSQNPRKVVKPNRKTVHNRPPVKPHRKSQTKSQLSKRSLLPRSKQKKDPKRTARVNTTQLSSTTTVPLFNTLKEQLEQELNKKILEVVEKISKHSVPSKSQNKKKVKRSAVLVEQLKESEPSILDYDQHKYPLLMPSDFFSKVTMQKSNNLGKRRLKRESDWREVLKKILATLNVTNAELNTENKKREKRSAIFVKSFIVSEPSILDADSKYLQKLIKLGKGRFKRKTDRMSFKEWREKQIASIAKIIKHFKNLTTNTENKTRVKRSARFIKQLKVSEPSVLDVDNEFKNSVLKLSRKFSGVNRQKFKKLNLRRPKRNNRSKDLESIKTAIGLIDVEKTSLPVHTLSSTKYLVTTKRQRYPLDDINKKPSKDFAYATGNNKNFKRSVSVTKFDKDLTILSLNNKTENLFNGKEYIIKSLDESKKLSDVAETVRNPTTKAVSSTYYEFLRKKGDIEKTVAEAAINKYVERNDTLLDTKNNENKTNSSHVKGSKVNYTIEKVKDKRKSTKTTINISDNARSIEFPATTLEKMRKSSFPYQMIPSFNHFYVTDKDSHKVTEIANTTTSSLETSTVKAEILLSIIDVTKSKNVYEVADLYTSKVRTKPLVNLTMIKEDESKVKLYKNPLLASNKFANVKNANWSYNIIEDIDELNNLKEASKLKSSYLMKQSTEGFFVLKSNDSAVEKNVQIEDQNITEQELIVKPLKPISAAAQPHIKKLESDVDTLTNGDIIHKHEFNSIKKISKEYNNNDETGKQNITVEELLNKLSKRTPTVPTKTDNFLKEPTESSTLSPTHDLIDFLKEATPKISYITIGDNIVIVKEKDSEKDLKNYTKAAYTIDLVTQLPDLHSNSYNIPPVPEIGLSLEKKIKSKGNKTQDSLSTNIHAADINDIDIKRHNYEIISDLRKNVTRKHLENEKATKFDVVEITKKSINNYIDDTASKIREQRFSTTPDLNTTTDKSVSKVLYSQYFTSKVPFRRRYDIKKIHSSSKKHKLTKIVSTLYNKSWKDEIFQIQPLQLSRNHTNITDNKSNVHDLKNFFHKIVNNLARHGYNERKNAKARKFKVVKYLQKFFKKIFSNGNNKNNALTTKLSKKNILKSLCTTFGPCDINNENKAKLHQMIDLLNKETYGMLKTIKIIKSLLRVIDFGKNDTNNSFKSKKMKFKSDVQKLHNILQNFYSGHPPLNNLSYTQRVKVSRIKNSTQDFVQSAARFTMILNKIINLVAPKNTSLLHSIEQKNYVDLKREQDLRQRTSDKSSVVNKLRELISKYSLMQNTFMRKMMKVLSAVDSKSVAKRTVETPKLRNNNETFQVYLQNVINNLRKLKTLADTEAPGRHKRELREDDSVEYLLMLMEYLLKHNRPEIAPVNDGIDLLIEAIKSAPDIKPMDKNIVTYPVNRSRLKITTPYVTTTTSTPIKPKSVTMKIIINSDSASDNSLPDNQAFNNISMKNDDFKLNYVEDDYDSPYANLAKNYKYQNGYYPEEEKQKRRLTVQHKYRKPKIQDIENDVQKLEYGSDITLNKNLDEVIHNVPYESPFQKLRKNVEKLSFNPPVNDLKSDVANLEANFEVLQKEFQSLQSYPVDQEVTPVVKILHFEDDKPVIGIDEVSTPTPPPPPVTTEIQLDVVLPVTDVLPVQYNASYGGGDEERAETFITEVEDEVLSPGFQFSKASTSPPIDSTISLDPVSIKVLNNNEDVSMSLSKSKLSWIDDAYVDDNKADSAELRAVIKSELNQSTERSHYLVGHLDDIDIMTTESQKEVKKSVKKGKEIQRDHAKEKNGITEVLRRKHIDLLNSLDYGTEKGDVDVSGSKEGNTEDKYFGDAFSWYFDK